MLRGLSRQFSVILRVMRNPVLMPPFWIPVFAGMTNIYYAGLNDTQPLAERCQRSAGDIKQCLWH
jgi:hypothetical protein